MQSKLKQAIIHDIEQNGPMALSTYIERCLYDEENGYYTNRKVFGTFGDFITAPEISQLFGELLGAWAIDTWQRLGAPKKFNLIEIGPGRGTLMNDMLRCFKTNPDFLKAANICLVEISGNLQKQQQKKLKPHGTNITWHKTIDALLNEPFILIGNEFLDALNFEQYEKTPKGWQIRHVAYQEGELSITLGDEILPQKDLPSHAARQPMGSVFEKSLPREIFIKTLAQSIKAQNGAALLIDYGPSKSGFGDSFQAMKDNQYCSPLDFCGHADLTNHVDFERLQMLAQKENIKTYPILCQGDFLIKLGLLERAGQLGHGKQISQQNEITMAVERLAGNDPKKRQMGELFKTLLLAPSKNTLAPFSE